MMVIGLTGGIASGKSTVAAMLEKANVPVIDADELAREVTKKGSPLLLKIVELFGKNVLTSDLSLDRKKLGSIVFSDQRLLKKLEAILHPEIKRLARLRLKELEKRGQKVAVYMAPLIFETDLQNELSKTILITAHREEVLKRAMARDQVFAEQIEKRLSAQLDDNTKIVLADYVIDNSGSLEDLRVELIKAWEKLTGSKLADP